MAEKSILKQFHEDGMILKVEVLEDLSDEKHERFRLKIIKAIKAPPVTVVLLKGTEFKCEKKRSVYIQGQWELKSLGFGRKK